MSTWTEAQIATATVTVKGQQYTVDKILTSGDWYQYFLTRTSDGHQVTTGISAKRQVAKNAALYELDRKTRAN